jgi:hypothetical protein
MAAILKYYCVCYNRLYSFILIPFHMKMIPVKYDANTFYPAIINTNCALDILIIALKTCMRFLVQ